MSEVFEITLEDIRKHKNLQELGVVPGDTWTKDDSGKPVITRVYSPKGGKKDVGIPITQQNLDDFPNLVEQNVEVGDRYFKEGHKIIKTGDGSAWKQFLYGVDEGDMGEKWSVNLRETLESWFPTRIGLPQDVAYGGFDEDNPEVGQYIVNRSRLEPYGQEFDDATPKERRSMIRRARERLILEEYPHFTPDPESGARIAGQLTSALLDPTSLIPFVGPARMGFLALKGAPLVANIGIGGALGGTHSILGDLSSGGGVEDIDASKAAQSAAFGGALTAAGIGLGAGTSALLRKRKISKREQAANKILDLADSKTKSTVERGADPENISKQYIADSTGVTIEQLELAEKIAKRQILDFKRPDNPIEKQASVSAPITKLPDEDLPRPTDDEVMARYMSKGFDEWIGVLSTRIGMISQPILKRFRVYEWNLKAKTHHYTEDVLPFLRQLDKIKGKDKIALSRQLYNGEFGDATEWMIKNGPEGMVDNFKVVQKTLEELHEHLDEALVDNIGHVSNFFPRNIKKKDYAKLLDHWGVDKSNIIAKALKEEVAKPSNDYNFITQIPEWRKNDIINNLFSQGSVKGTGGKFKHAKQRVIGDVTEDILPFYMSPEESLELYIRSSVNAIEKARFLGKNIKKSKRSYDMEYVGNSTRQFKEINNKEVPYDQNKSIGELINEYSKDISADDADELRGLIKSRVEGGNLSGRTELGTVRDLGYMATIANPISALTQMVDMGATAALHGFRNTFMSMFGTKNVKMMDVYLDDAAQEFADVRKSAKILKKLFKITQFERVDRLSKETAMNAALRKNFKLLSTKEGEKEFVKKWGAYYKEEIDSVIEDLRSGQVTERVKFHAFTELSDLQPISMSELPQKYLDMPNGRLLYMLKTFQIKQWDVVRRNIMHEYSHGSKKKAVKKAGALALYLSAFGVSTQAIKDSILLRDPDLENMPGNAMWGLLSMYGLNKYNLDQLSYDKDVGEYISKLFLPALPMFNAALALGMAPFEDNPKLSRHLRSIPGIGPFAYNWIGGGAEKYNDWIERERRKGKDKPLYPY